MAPATLKTWFDIAESAAKILAILVGGFWTYSLFVRKREQYPRATVTIGAFHEDLSDQWRLLHVVVSVKNTGEVLLRLEKGDIRISQVSPPWEALMTALKHMVVPDSRDLEEIERPALAYKNLEWGESPREIEPGECDEYHFDFVVPSSTRAVQVYTYMKNVSRTDREMGWNTEAFFVLDASTAIGAFGHGATRPDRLTFPPGKPTPNKPTPLQGPPKRNLPGQGPPKPNHPLGPSTDPPAPPEAPGERSQR